MARLVLASGPVQGRGPRRGHAGRLHLPLGYTVCGVMAAASLLLGRLDAPVFAEPWAPPAPAPDQAPSPPPVPHAQPAPAATVRVIDGDTLDLAGERVRLVNIDAPEMPPRSKCASEAEGALAATARLQALVEAGPVTLARTGVDRYGRTLAHVYVDGADAGGALVAAGLVRPWEGRRRSWCA